jgi:hypothetical protein
MPIDIDPETMNADDLPAIWSPVQWEMTEDERLEELDTQATANLLWAADVPEAILRLLLSECDVERAFEPPEGYDPEEQGEWDESMTTFQFRQPIQLLGVERSQERLYAEYRFPNLGYWAVEITANEARFYRI